MKKQKILEVKNLKTYFPLKRNIFGQVTNYVKAVDDVSFDLYKGEVLGIVGETGSGKSTIGRSLLRLVEPTGGSIFYRGQNITKIKREKLRKIRKNMQMIFQDPFASLNPRISIGESIVEPMREHAVYKKSDCFQRALKLLEKVGLDKDYYTRYPHEFSGGQRQRVGIARALALNPEIIIADEAVSSLDVSVQAQIINLFSDLQQELGLTYIFIAHDLSVVKFICDRIIVIYLGEIMEIAKKEDLSNHPLHPYTQALISAIPVPDPKKRGKRIILKGEIPSPAHPPIGCKFSTRCPKAMDICHKVHPDLVNVDKHQVRCHLYQKKRKNELINC